MGISIDMATLEKLNKFVVENVDSKYKGIVDPKGIDWIHLRRRDKNGNKKNGREHFQFSRFRISH